MRDAAQPDAVPVAHPHRIGRRLRVARRAGVALLAAGVVALLVFGPEPRTVWNAVRSHLDSWQIWAARNGPFAVLSFLLAGAVLTALPLPILMVLSLAAGALFGAALGTAVVSLAYTAGVTTTFLVARWLMRDWVRRSAASWLRRVERGVDRDGAYYLLTLRLMPSIPFFLVNVLMALTPIRTSTYALVSWVGVLPMSFLCAGVGTRLAAIETPADAVSLPVFAALAVLAVAPLLIRKLVRLVRPHAPNPGSA